MTAATQRKPTSEPAPTFLSASQQMMEPPREASAVREGNIPTITMHTERVMRVLV